MGLRYDEMTAPGVEGVRCVEGESTGPGCGQDMLCERAVSRRYFGRSCTSHHMALDYVAASRI